MCISTCPPLLADHLPLLVDLLIGQGQATRPVVQDQQTGVRHPRLFHGSIHHHIDGLVEAGISIEILSTPHTGPFDEVIHAMSGEVLAAVEGHVLQKMGQSTLVLLFKDGAYILGNVEIGTLLRQFVVTKIIGESVGQLTVAYLRVNR